MFICIYKIAKSWKKENKPTNKSKKPKLITSLHHYIYIIAKTKWFVYRAFLLFQQQKLPFKPKSKTQKHITCTTSLHSITHLHLLYKIIFMSYRYTKPFLKKLIHGYFFTIILVWWLQAKMCLEKEIYNWATIQKRYSYIFWK